MLLPVRVQYTLETFPSYILKCDLIGAANHWQETCQRIYFLIDSLSLILVIFNLNIYMYRVETKPYVIISPVFSVLKVDFEPYFILFKLC